MNPLIFREYDLRGLADTDLTDEVVDRLGKAFGTYAQKHGYRKAVLGCDVRLSSPRIAQGLARGIQATGCDVVDIGVVPSPVFYYSFFEYDFGAGLMVTASHNPKEFNGMKIGLDKATIYGAEIQAFRRLAESGEFLHGKGSYLKLDVVPSYLAMLRSKVSIARRLKVVFDPGNGTVGPLIQMLAKSLPIEPIFTNLEPDGRFPNHLPDPTVPAYMQEAIALVKETGADLGIGYDGDGDRIGVIDDQGGIVYGDRLLALFAEEILSRKPGATIVFEVKCSQGLIDHIKAHGGKPLMWKTGHSLIKAKMKEVHAAIAGEMSGHMFFADGYLGYDDAIFASLRLMKLLADSGKSLAELASRIPKYYATPEIRIDCPDAVKFQVVKAISEQFRREHETIDIDGVRVVFPDGWALARASNTQPAIVVRFEARTPERLAEFQKLFYDRLRAFPEVKLTE